MIVVLAATLIWSCHSKEMGPEPDIVFAPPMGIVFSAVDGTSSVISFFDLEAMRVVRTMPMSGIVRASDMNLAGDLLVLADGQNDRISIYRLPEMSVTHIGELGGEPLDVANSFGTGYVYAISRNGYFWIDSVAAGTLDTMEIHLAPRRLALRPPSRDEAWIVNPCGLMIQIILLPTEELQDSILFTDPPSDIRFSPDGEIAYIAFSEPQCGVTAYSASTHESVANYPLSGSGPFDLAISDDGQYLAASDSALGNVHLLNLETQDLWTIKIGRMSGHVCFAHDSHTLYALAGVDNQVKRIRIGADGPLIVDSVGVTASATDTILWEHRN